MNNKLWTGYVILLDKMDSPDNNNLSERIKEQLPEEVAAFVRLAGVAAEKRQQRLYLVGGVVRDLLLNRVNFDIDIVVEGDAIKFAESLAGGKETKVITHPRFGTATLKWNGRSADFATARAETYARPGALPKVKPGTIKDDLARRDFTINAMAIELNPKHFGELIDPFGGQTDLKAKVVRVLHEKSFTDDATRIWRAVRYEQRLDFKIEPVTLLLIERDLPMLKTVSGDRIRHELELIFNEDEPEKALARAGDLGVLAMLHPNLKADAGLTAAFILARDRCESEFTIYQLYLALLAYPLSAPQTQKFIAYLKLPKVLAQVLQDTPKIKAIMKELTEPGQAPSAVYNLLHGYHLMALTAASIMAEDAYAQEHIELYLNVLRHINPALAAEDLVRLGVKRGPKIKEVLQSLREARLDGKIASKKEEAAWVRGLKL